MTAALRRAFGAAAAVLAAVLVAGVAIWRLDPLATVAAALVFASIALLCRFGIVDHGNRPFGAANRITTARAAMACFILATVGAAPDPALQWLVAALGGLAIVLDGVDGWLARRSSLASAFGARFDMEIDALTILVLSLALASQGAVGAWIVASGLLRYGFVAASWLWPALAAPLPPGDWRRVCAVVQGATLAVAMIPILPGPLAAAIAAAGLATAVGSFGIDILWLVRNRGRVAPASLVQRLRRLGGVLRSLAIYHGIPGRARRLRRLYAPFVPRGGLAIDVGAHAGNRVRCWRRLGARVVAVEPQPAFAAILRRLFGADPDVALLTVALDAREGEATLHVSDRTPTVSTLAGEFIDAARSARSFDSVTWDRPVTVATTTLDALIARHGRPDFIKIDVEGAEPRVLAGLSSAVPALSFEVVPAAPDAARACVDRLAALGDYRFNWSPGESHRMAWADWVDEAALRRWLAALKPDDPSGDVYARRAG